MIESKRMTSRASFRQSTIEKIIRAAQKTGAAVQVDLTTLVVTIFPGAGPTPRLASPKPVLAPDGDEDWNDVPRKAPVREGKGGYPIIDDPNDPLTRWYNDLGFDPRTMNETDMKRLMAENHANWMASIPGTKIGKREESALRNLVAIGVDVRVLQSDVKGCGDETTDRLQARGFIGRRQTLTEAEVEAGRTREEIWLLKEGLDAWNRLPGKVKE
jgi:hypothetical protein